MPHFSLSELWQIPRKVQESCTVHDVFRISSEILGEGSYGKVQPACDGDSCRYVAKRVKLDSSRFPEPYLHNVFFAECAISQYAGRHGFGIPVHDFYLCDEGHTGMMIMDRFTRDLLDIADDLSWPDLKQLLAKVHTMHQCRILHRDLFLKNTMYRKNHSDGQREIRIIDFGMSLPFEHDIPAVFRAIDFINLLSDVPEGEPKEQCWMTVKKYVGTEALHKAQTWVDTHQSTCQSEFALLPHIPEKWIEWMGPATVDTLVWSVRCDEKLDRRVVHLTKERVKKVLAAHEVMVG